VTQRKRQPIDDNGNEVSPHFPLLYSSNLVVQLHYFNFFHGSNISAYLITMYILFKQTTFAAEKAKKLKGS